MERVGEDFRMLVDVIMREQMINSSSKDLQVWLKERKPKSADEMFDLADAYQSTHRGSVIVTKGHTQSTPKDSKGKSREQKFVSSKPKGKSDKCFLCHRTGHFQQIWTGILKRIREENINLVNHRRKPV
jgi:hypothetical protein